MAAYDAYCVVCACGFGRKTQSYSGAEAVAEQHREDGVEGCDHVTAVEHVRHGNELN